MEKQHTKDSTSYFHINSVVFVWGAKESFETAHLPELYFFFDSPACRNLSFAHVFSYAEFPQYLI